MKKRVWIKLVGLIVVLLFLLSLILQNQRPAQVKFLFFETGNIPQSLLLGITFVIGLVAGIILTFLISSRAQKK